jgi:[CysO sulfur-carrier protein]-S-L-cysteine hydrolase
VTAVRVPRAIAEAIARHARAERPNEACGLVVGSALPADGGIARRYVACRNAAASPSRYAVDRDDLLRVLSELDRTGEELWGVVHSHVRTAAVPSTTDIGEAAWPAALYLLVSLALDADPPSLRAWRIANGTATELPLTIDDDVEGAA